MVRSKEHHHAWPLIYSTARRRLLNVKRQREPRNAMDQIEEV